MHIAADVDLRGILKNHSDEIVLAVSAILFLLMLDYCLDNYPPKDDVINFFNQAQMMKDGLVPYRDFVFEFPPFALVFFYIPAMFTSDLNEYAAIFGVMVTLFSLLCLYYMLRICDRMKLNKVLVAALFTVLMLMYYREMVKKFDVIPMTLVVASIYYYMRGNRLAAYGLAMAGAFTKMYPVLILVMYFMLDVLTRERRSVNIRDGAVASLVILAVAVVPLILAGDSIGDVFSFLTFHTDRGFQVESVVGVVIQGLGILGFTTFSLVEMYGTYDVISPISDILLPFWNVFVLLVLAAVFALIAYNHTTRKSGESVDRMVLVYATVLILAFVLTNKVFSTQYMLWLFPFMALLPMVPGRIIDQNWTLMTYMVLIEAFAVIMTSDYQQGTAMFVEQNLIRDLMMVGLMVSLIMFILRRESIHRRFYSMDVVDGEGGPVA